MVLRRDVVYSLGEVSLSRLIISWDEVRVTLIDLSSGKNPVGKIARCGWIGSLLQDWNSLSISVLIEHSELVNGWKISKEMLRLDLCTNLCARNINRDACVCCNLWSATGMRLFLIWWHSIWKNDASLIGWTFWVLRRSSYAEHAPWHIFVWQQLSCADITSWRCVLPRKSAFMRVGKRLELRWERI